MTTRTWLRVGLGVVAVLALYDIGVQLAYANRVLPGVKVGDLSLAGKTASEAQSTLEERASKVQRLTFVKDGQRITFSASEIGLEIDSKTSAEAALGTGRGNILNRALKPLAFLTGHTDSVPLRYGLVDSALQDKLTAATKDLANPAKNASIVRVGNQFRIVPESAGTIVDPAANDRAARRAIEEFTSTIPLYIRDQQPEIRARDLTTTRAYAAQLAAKPFEVVAGSDHFTAPPTTVASWVTFEPRLQTVTMHPLLQASLLPHVDEALGIGVSDAPIVQSDFKTLYAVANVQTIGEYVNEVAQEADKPPVNARLAFTNNQLTVTGAPEDGVVINREAAVKTIATSLKSPERTATLAFQAKKADIRQETLPQLGINTLIGSATTTFGGSPVNRIFNIGVGAARFDGALIKPGEEFSFNDVLGDVGPETGYRQELVILEKKTVPQYGGGLCQVSTTMFRAALSSGLPITERTNHSYAVVYYAPLGMDATIYPGGPDMKFKNNTPGWILVQTHQEGTQLTFDFFGSKDGRQSSTQLLTQNASTEAGGTASFHYSVVGGPDPIEKTFFSSYQPHSAFPVANSLN